MQLGACWVSETCLTASRPRQAIVRNVRLNKRALSHSSPLYQSASPSSEDGAQEQASSKKEGAMSRRLAEMTQETLETGGRSAKKAIEEAGFSEELKKQLEEKIARSSFKAENQQAFSISEMPSYVGAGTRAHAAAEPWSGTEIVEDAALRMLDDSHKKLRVPGGRPPRINPTINLKPAPKPKNVSAGERLANARDKTSIYTLSQQGMSDKEREQLRKDLKERFTPGARAMPVTLTGLQSLANERIEDAISRGQFKNIPRGKGVNIERDYTASSPFLDTTEYFMNKIIQKQEIVPPWIEKQQELIKAVHSFRSRLRNDWRRHAARMIASQGGSVESQVRKAKAYALAEARFNPVPVKSEALSKIDSQGNLSSIIIQQTAPSYQQSESTSDADTESLSPNTVTTSTITISETPTTSTEDVPSDSPSSEASTSIEISATETTPPSTASNKAPPIEAADAPFRDRSWESLESAYHKLAITELNSMTRSYNLMAPKVAQKPYYNLERELNRCYAEVGAQLPQEILVRSRAAKVKATVIGHKNGGIMERFGASQSARIYDDRRKPYGFKEFWKDLWSGEAKL